MKDVKNWIVDDFIPWFNDGGWILMPIVSLILFISIWTAPQYASRFELPSTFTKGQEVRLKATGGKGVVVRRIGLDYLVRYAEQDGRLNSTVMDECELIDWPSSYQIPKPEASR